MENFSITYTGWKPEEQKLREALCTLGNGYMATRGAAEEHDRNDFNYPGTYLAGGYNRAKTKVADKVIENEDFVNFPNWLCLTFKPEGGERLNLQTFKILDYKQTLEMSAGVLVREFRAEDKSGRRSFIRSRRFVSMRDKHMAALEWTFCPENWGGTVEFISALDGTVINDNVERYRDLESRHLDPLKTEKPDENSMLLMVQTRQSKITMAQAARTKIYRHGEEVNAVNATGEKEGAIEQLMRFDVKEGEKYTVEKIVTIYSSRDRAISETSLEATKSIKRAGRFEDLLKRHQNAVGRLWHRADIKITDGDKIQQLLRLHIFHVLQTVSFNTIGLDTGIPSRGMHGEAYRGHIFWDELYILPFLNLRFPEISRSLLMYRYERMDEARFAAKEAGYKGAMFPWQSGSNGREESQEIHLNPKSGRWIPDNTYLQRHVNCAIAYNIWNYYLTGDDRQFLSAFGAEIFLSIAKFWASKAFYNEKRKRYEIHNVVGPDEYHTSYPNSDQQGLNNNAYTNIFVAWVFQKALEIPELIGDSRKKELLEFLSITEKDLGLWDEMSRKMFVPFIDKSIISQFEGYDDLEEFSWEKYRQNYGNIERLDRILESEGDSPNKYKASKQADVLMLFYLFSKNELQALFTRLGYEFKEEMIHKNIAYYQERTSHGSTLSRFVFSWVQAKYNKNESWKHFEKLIVSDFEDIQGGTTPEGIHLGAMAGSLSLIQRCYSGLELGDEALWIKPDLPQDFKKISMRVKYRKHWISLEITQDKLTVGFEEGRDKTVKIGVLDKIYEFTKGEIREFSLKGKSE